MTCTFRLETVDGAPADPPMFQTVAPLWRPGDTIYVSGWAGSARTARTSARWRSGGRPPAEWCGAAGPLRACCYFRG
jgi:hypothetical protein